MPNFSKIVVVGLGYIGLPTAAMFASHKVKVVGVDVNEAAVGTINRGEIHIFEPDLEGVVQSAVRAGYLRATTAMEPANAFLIAVPTPFQGDNRDPDLSFIKAAAQAIAPVLEAGNLVVLESTSPVGTTEQLAAWLTQSRPDLTFPTSHGDEADIRIAHCPERVLPGKVMQELVFNDRVIGGLSPRCAEHAKSLYEIFAKGECVITNARTAEMAKLTENSFRDVNIAFANELALICDELSIDVWELLKLANRHPRVNILQPGPGVGGHCIAVDPWFIVSSAPSTARLIRLAREVNDGKPQWVLEKVAAAAADWREKAASPALRPRIACYGLAFKPDIDDLRESPAVAISTALVGSELGDIWIVEPHIPALPAALDGARLVELQTALQEADIHVMLVDHRAFIGQPRPAGAVIDTRGLWTDPAKA